MEIAAGMGLGIGSMAGGGGGATAGGMNNLNQFMLQNLQALIAANPEFLTGGIPTKLLSQMWMEPSRVLQSFAVCAIFFTFTSKIMPFDNFT